MKLPEWTWYATGPGHGLQLVSGRLLIPCDHIVGRDFNQATDPYLSHVILSDDQGENWRLGGEAQLGTNECMAAQLADGRVYLNERNYIGEHRRAFAVSHDEGESFDAFGWHDELIDPICQAAVLSLGGDRLVFSNAASRTRERLTRANEHGRRAVMVVRACSAQPGRPPIRTSASYPTERWAVSTKPAAKVRTSSCAGPASADAWLSST